MAGYSGYYIFQRPGRVAAPQNGTFYGTASTWGVTQPLVRRKPCASRKPTSWSLSEPSVQWTEVQSI